MLAFICSLFEQIFGHDVTFAETTVFTWKLKNSNLIPCSFQINSTLVNGMIPRNKFQIEEKIKNTSDCMNTDSIRRKRIKEPE